jgi:hypothetical protein
MVKIMLDGEEKSLAVVEIYRWVLVLPPRSGILRLYITLKFTNSLLDFAEVEVMTEKTGTSMKTGSIRAQADDPSEYMDFVLDVLVQLFNIFELSEEHYTYDAYF